MKTKRNKGNKYCMLMLVIILASALLGIVFFSEEANAVPPLPTEIYGTAKTYNSYLMPGTIISVYDSENNFCGSYRAINNNGTFYGFGVLTCKGEDDVSAGPTQGEVLSFRIGVAPAAAVQIHSKNKTALNYSLVNITWESGTFKEVMLVAPPLICGDKFCDTLENCKICQSDCGVCPQGNTTTSPSNNSGSTPTGGTGGSGGGGSGSKGTSGDAAGGDAQSGDAEAEQGEQNETECTEDWMCGEWDECLVTNVQFRDCADLNDCGTSEKMPEVTRDCDYAESIYGQNQTAGNGTAPTKPSRETPGLISVCKDKLPLLSLPSIIFVVLLVIILLLAQFDYGRRLKKINSDRNLDELKKLELKYFEKRKKAIFFVVIIILAIIVYLYHYFFFVCRDKYVMYLWLLASGILMAPVIVHLLIELSIFSESSKNRRVSVLNDIHYRHFELLVEIADKELVVAEKNIIDKIYLLEQKEEFHRWLSKDKIVNKIYADMNKLYNLYKTLQNPMFVEKDLLESIRKLDEDSEFVNAAKIYPELVAIKANLSLLYSAYEYKQTLYDELSAIEKEYGVNQPLVR